MDTASLKMQKYQLAERGKVSDRTPTVVMGMSNEASAAGSIDSTDSEQVKDG
jgi:hypothetical protein